MRKRIGYTVPVKKQMFVHAAFDGNIAIAKSSRAAAVTRKIGTLEPGCLVSFEKIVHRRLQPGVFYFYVCRDRAQRLKFDVSEGDEDDYFDWSKAVSNRRRSAAP
jgi:hypothetical protein